MYFIKQIAILYFYLISLFFCRSSPSPPAVPVKEKRELPSSGNNISYNYTQSSSLHPHSPLPPPPPPASHHHHRSNHSTAPASSLADAFSSEMLAWYQDQNVAQTRSATLV